ncbi:hypothetical protein AW879_07795 [Enterobacter cloacae]|nr:hypothetical protein AW879_07795 [Enterobacter cloacae]
MHNDRNLLADFTKQTSLRGHQYFLLVFFVMMILASSRCINLSSDILIHFQLRQLSQIFYT